MFGMEPSVQLQEYSTEFFHTIKPQKKKIIKTPLYYSDTRGWPEIQKSKEIQSGVKIPNGKINIVS